MRIKNFLIFIVCVGFLFGPGTSRATGETPLRDEQVAQYLEEFASGAFQGLYPNIGKALKNAFLKLPDEVFEKITDRRHPTIFINTISTGIARYANSKEFLFREGDAPALQEGFYLIILGDELNNVSDAGAIEGVILHELAHNYLEHLKEPKHNCEMEREANRLVIAWGYEEEYEKASAAFGAKEPGDSPCQDYFNESNENNE